MKFSELKKVRSVKNQKSFSVYLFVLYAGKRIPLKDAYRALTGKKVKNSRLDSTKITNFLIRNGIQVYYEAA